MNIYPSVLTDSISEAQKQIMWAASDPHIRAIQVDVIDGVFTDEVTVTAFDLATLDWGEANCDLHLMTEEPLDFVYEAIDTKEYVPFRTIIAQIEKMSSQPDFVELVKKHQWQVGLSLDLFTPVEAIDEEVWDKLDSVQLMAVEAGAQGQPLQVLIYEKIKQLAAEAARRHHDVEIIIDGGVKPEHIARLHQEGAHSITVGSGLWSQPDVWAAIREYAQATEAAETSDKV
jgi:pentose-5-phosphate-3-epimerase